MTAKTEQDNVLVRYDGSRGPKLTATQPGDVGGEGKTFLAGEIQELDDSWGRMLVQHGPFDLCIAPEQAAERLGLDPDLMTALLPWLPVAEWQPGKKAKPSKLIVLHSSAYRALAAAAAIESLDSEPEE